jgi:hypothetical protein
MGAKRRCNRVSTNYNTIAVPTIVVPGVGIEPTRGVKASQDFKSCTSTNSVTPACAKYTNFSNFNFEATEGFAPSHSGFADRRVASSPRGRLDTLALVREFVEAASVLLAHVDLKCDVGR